MRFRSGLVTVLDQAWLSLLNLAISLAFIRFSSKREFGVYLLLMTPLYLVQGVQNALLLSPIATVLPATQQGERPSVIDTAVSAQVVFITTSSVLASIALGAYFLVTQDSIDLPLCFAFSLALAGTMAREAGRGLSYTQGLPERALRSDVVYGIGLLSVIAGLIVFGYLSAKTVLIGTGIATLWPYLFQISSKFRLALTRDVLLQFWACGRWALLGVLVTWVNLNAYPLIVGMSLNTSSVADINAARLFMMPFVLGITGWSNLVRPSISAWMAKGNLINIRRISLQSIMAGLLAISCFTAVIYLAYPIIEPFLGSEYSGLARLIVLWAIFFAFALVRTVFMASLMTDAHGYRELQAISWYALVLSLAGLWWLTPRGVQWVIGVLIAVEAFQLLMVSRKALAIWKTQ